MKKFAYHCGQRINDACAPSVAVVRKTPADWSHVIMTQRVLPATTIRIFATTAPQGRTNLYALYEYRNISLTASQFLAALSGIIKKGF